MRRFIITVMVLAAMAGTKPFCCEAQGQEPSVKVIVPLSFPHRYNTAMENGPVISKPLKVSGVITVGAGVVDSAQGPDTGRYLVEYFIDDLAIGKAGNVNKYIRLDTSSYENGPHKLIVNFWDRDGRSAIGVCDIIIDNRVEAK
jgi:hypothetical protein